MLVCLSMIIEISPQHHKEQILFGRKLFSFLLGVNSLNVTLTLFVVAIILLCWDPPSVSQRIAAADLAPGLLYFGRSIHGTMDMNNDGLVDLAVGSLGAAVLLWLVFHPENNCCCFYLLKTL